MILQVHLHGAGSHAIGDEIWEESLAAAIREESLIIADCAAPDLLVSLAQHDREGLRDLVAAEMTRALTTVGDSYRAPDGVLYSLCDAPALDQASAADSLAAVVKAEPVVEEVLKFEGLPIGSLASRRAIVRWSDGTETEALRWYSDEVLVCEGDLIGKTRAELSTLHFRRDRDWLQS